MPARLRKQINPKYFKCISILQKFFLSTPRTASSKSLSEFFLRQILFILCVRNEDDMIWWSQNCLGLTNKQIFRFSEQSFALDLLYFVCEVRRPGVNDVKASSSWRTLDLIPIKDQWSHLEDTRSNTNELYQRININNHHQRILHQITCLIPLKMRR